MDTKAAVLAMKSKKQGVIVNILSTSALAGRPNSAAYAASKFAAMGFSKSLREGVKDEGITVINVYPGGMQTNFFDEQVPEDYNQYMDPAFVAEKIVRNLMQNNPEEELLVKRPNA